MLFDLLNPDESILSVFKNNILMKDTVYLSEGTHYKLAIKNNSLPEQDLTYIKDFITDRLNLSDEMNIQTTAVELEEQLKKIGYVNVRADIEVEDGFINVYISYDDRVTLFKANISDGKDTIKLNSIDQVKELASIGNIEESKKIIITELKSRGFIDATIKNFNLKTSKGVMTLDVEVDLGNQTLINTVYINGKKVFTNLLLPFTEDNIAIVKQQVFEYVSDKTFIKDIELEKIRNGGIYFKVIGEEIKVADVLSNIPDLGNNIRKKFFYKDKKLTTKKWQEIYTYLMINKNAEYISLNMTEMDNKTILTIYKVEAKPNRFSGSISFDSVDKLTLELGYKRFNIFDTGRVLGLSGKISTNEKSISLSVSGQKTIGRIVDDSHSIFYKKRDEFDFRYKNPALESIFRIRYKLAEFFTGFRIEHINIYSTDFSDEYDQMYRKKYNVLSLPLKAIIRNKDFETYENYGVMLALSEQPAISSKDDFLLHKGYIEGYKTFFSNYLVRVKADIERVSSGNDVPLNYLLTLGGPDKMKAFSYRKLGKHDPNTGDTIGSKALVYSYYMLGYKPSRNITVGPFFEYGGIGDSFSSLNFYKDIGVELLVTAKELGSLSFSYAYNPFSPYSGKQAFYINFGINF
jgi:outer membrane protein insertion porin family